MPGEIETAHNFPRDILRDILGPMFDGVERDNPDRVAVLAGHQVVDGGFEIGLGDIGFRECGAQLAEIVDDKINRLIVAVRHNRGVQLRRMGNSQQRDTGNLSTELAMVPAKK